jgi:hypothetical protein
MLFSDAGQTFSAALLFAAVFLFGGRLYAPVSILRKNAVSLGAGASVAYIFIQLLPELENAGAVFRSATSHLALPYQGQYGLHLATMIGFLIFYGLDEMVSVRQAETSETTEKAIGEAFCAHMAGFGSYAWITSYLLVRSLEKGEGSLLIYAIAMGLHFFLCAHSLREDYGDSYDRIGSRLLAGCSLGGWLCGVLLDLPKSVVVILFGLVAGGVLVNTMIMELPRHQKGKFIPFLIGAAVYATLIIGRE